MALPTILPEKDIVVDFQGARIQHGGYNDRIYLMKLGEAEPEALADSLLQLAEKKNYSKIFARIPLSTLPPFQEKGFIEEARIPGFFCGRKTAVFLGYYLDRKRERPSDPRRLDQVLKSSRRKQVTDRPLPPLPNEFCLRSCGPNDIRKMADIYRRVFDSYPFPIHDPDYILTTMENHVAYFGIEAAGELIALAAAEIDRDAEAAEMTDFATLPRGRGRGFGLYLLEAMEEAAKEEGIKTFYTIARARSFPMNITFARAGYRYGGRLVNNTNISGKIESMNVWYKSF